MLLRSSTTDIFRTQIKFDQLSMNGYKTTSMLILNYPYDNNNPEYLMYIYYKSISGGDIHKTVNW